MDLAAHALGYSTLWFTLFDKKAMREILDVARERVPLALVCVGKPASSMPVPRKAVKEKVRYLRSAEAAGSFIPLLSSCFFSIL